MTLATGRLPVRMLLASLAAILLWACPVQAQTWATPLPPGAIATTYCLGGRVTSVINLEVVGTDSLEEIAAHEAKHREQMARSAPECPNLAEPTRLLAFEIEAYCASRPYRMRRGYSQAEVDEDYIARIQADLGRVYPPKAIELLYHNGCP